MTNAEINEIFGITESYQLPEKLMSILMDFKQRTELFEKFNGLDLSHDFFTRYFQEQHSNRENMMQDFTPQELCDVVVNTLGEYSDCLDVCAGTGGLTISAWKKNPDANYYVEELSGRAYPILLFNLAIRNIKGYVINKDVLTKEFKRGFKLSKGDKYSEIEEIWSEPDMPKFQAVIMNPPYSLKHEWDTAITDCRFEGYGYPPTKASDYAFVMDGLYNMGKGGTLTAVLPHGVLFRGGSEKTIREKLVINGILNEVIGLPEKLFLNTAIPVCLMILRHESKDLLFIDASKDFEKDAKLNRLRQEDIEKIKETSRKRQSIEKYAEVVSFWKVKENDYNLNIPRYVDSYEEPEPIDIDATLDRIKELDCNINKTMDELAKMLNELKGGTEDTVFIKKSVDVMQRGRSKKKVDEQTTIFDFIGRS